MNETTGGQSQIENQTSKIAMAWSVHAFTAIGLILAAAMAVLIVRGDAPSIRWAFVLMLVATIVDAVDGTLARLARVKEVLPNFDGRRLDDIIDFQTYTSLPLLLVWRAEILPPHLVWLLVVPLLASAYGFCQGQAKTDDGYFLGFPSYWNLVAFYLYVLRPPGWLSLGLILVLSALTFVPTRYLYLTQGGRLNQWSTVAGLAWAGLPVWILFRLPISGAAGVSSDGERLRWLAVISLFFPIYYMVASWAISVKAWLNRPEDRDRRRSVVNTKGPLDE